MTKIGKYDIVRELGRGAMGIVYEGFDPVIGRKVAIKTIRFDVLVGERERAEAQERFLREARSAGNLAHPCIVTIYDVGEDAGLSYIAMEYIDGESLDMRIARGSRMPLDQVASLIARIGDALDFAHRHGVVHRDIKPANILIGRDERPKLVDFGIARISSSALTHTNAVLGTPFYMAPEQIAGQPTDHRADLFSLGAVLYEMLTRTKPFPGENVTTVIYNIMSAEPRPPRDFDASLPPGFDVICQTALAKDPSARYQSGQALSDALRAQAAGYAAPGRTDADLSAAETQVVPAHLVSAAAAAAGTPPKGIAALSVPGPVTSPAPAGGAPAVRTAAGPAAVASKKGRSPVVPLLLLVALMAAAGGGFWLWRSGQPPALPEAQDPVVTAPSLPAAPETPTSAGPANVAPGGPSTGNPAPAPSPAPAVKGQAGSLAAGRPAGGAGGRGAAPGRTAAAAMPVPEPPPVPVAAPDSGAAADGPRVRIDRGGRQARGQGSGATDLPSGAEREGR